MKNDLWEDIIVQTASVFINDHSMTRIEVLVQVLFLGPKVYKSHRWIDARAIHDIVFLSTGVAHNLFFCTSRFYQTMSTAPLEMTPSMSSLSLLNREEQGSTDTRVSFPANPVSSVHEFSRSPQSLHSELFYNKKDYERFQRDERNRWKRAIRRALVQMESSEQVDQAVKDGGAINEMDGTHHQRRNNEDHVAPFNMASAA